MTHTIKLLNNQSTGYLHQVNQLVHSGYAVCVLVWATQRPRFRHWVVRACRSTCCRTDTSPRLF